MTNEEAIEDLGKQYALLPIPIDSDSSPWAASMRRRRAALSLAIEALRNKSEAELAWEAVEKLIKGEVTFGIDKSGGYSCDAYYGPYAVGPTPQAAALDAASKLKAEGT